MNTADLNAAHIGKRLSIHSVTDAWFISGTLFAVEHTADRIDTATLCDTDVEVTLGRPRVELTVGPFEFTATGAETVQFLR